MARQGKERIRTFENVKEFWNKEGKELGNEIIACIRDNEYRKLEIEKIISVIKGKGKVLDLACGNGYCTAYYSSHVKNIIGADYSEELIKKAKRLVKNFPEKQAVIKDNIDFEVASALKLPYPDHSFDVVIAQRLLVNLPEAILQKQAIKEIYRVLKPNGTYIFSEATFQGHKNIDEFRGIFNLPPMEKHWHNLYIDEDIFIPYLKRYFKLLEKNRFGTYHFISKILHPLMVWPNDPAFDSPINKVAKKVAAKLKIIPELEKASHHLFMVFKKKNNI